MNDFESELDNFFSELDFGRVTIFAAYLTRLISILFFPTVLLIPFTTLLTGILFSIPIIGFLSLTLVSLIWMLIFYLPMMFLSFIWLKAPMLRLFIIPIGVPLSVIANLYCGFISDMGEKEQKLMKLSICDNWFFSFQIYKYTVNEGADWTIADSYIQSMIFKK
tara:strand:- start:45 stop:536 length:492 start_codon:yes stop_codon:yes gene_type:complete